MKCETKAKIKGIVAGSLATALLVGGGVFAAQRSEMIEVFYDDIEIVVDGQKIEPKDANGNAVQPFIYNGTTYLPVRAVGNAINKKVDWDGVDKVVYLGAKPGEESLWLEQCPPYQTRGWTKYTLADNKFFTMSGNNYTNGYVSNIDGTSQALFNLNGKYNKFEFTVGHIDGTNEFNATMNIFLDGTIAYTTTLSYEELARKITIPLEGALQMKIEIKHSSSTTKLNGHYGISEGKFE